MTSDHERTKALFLAAIERPATERRAFLIDACGDNETLRLKVESLLAFHEDDNCADAAASGWEPEQDAERFKTGEVFASRYRMIARIGRGGMGDVWRADDLVLETPVALKLIDSSGPATRARILNEVRLARQITHRSVCRVFDVGEAEGDVFFSMELVRGEDLATLLRRVGRLPSEKVIDIGRQLCAGVAAAHAQGVLHRDLKPANVLIDDEGLIRITDFGIAVARTESGHHTLIGTPGYMAPEQLTQGTPLSERTDVYALGVILYELLVGEQPAERSGAGHPPLRPSAVVPGVDAQLERVILQALSPDPGERPGSALAMASFLETASTPKRYRKPRVWLAAGAVVIVVGALAVALPLFLTRASRTLTEQDTIVIADFANTTGEAVFDGTLKVALAVALEQSPFLKVFPDERVREALSLMKRSPDEPVTRAIAREIARREQLKALLAGSIGSLGRNYVLALEAINAETGDVMAREQVEVPNKEQVLTSLGKSASKLREKLGESLASVQKFDAPLVRATTPSLEALHAYTLALDEGRASVRLSSIPHLKRAIELDPDFALAHAMLSAVYANTDQPGVAPAFAERAFELRDRVSERERFFISWRYYKDATFAAEKALELARSWTATYPREPLAFNSLGLALTYLGLHEQAVEPFREGMRLDPKFFASYGNLGEVLIALNRLDEAKETLHLADARQINVTAVRRVSYLLAFVRGDSAEMARQFDLAAAVPESNAFAWQARTSVFAGRLTTAHEQFRRAIQTARDRGLDQSAAQMITEDAEFDAIVGRCGDARQQVSASLALSRDNFTLQRASRTLALCGAANEALGLSDELRRRFPDAMLTLRVIVPVTAAVIALQRGNVERTRELLEPVRPYDRTQIAEFWPSYLRGLAYLQSKHGKEASVEFQYILDQHGVRPMSPLFALAHLGLARADAMTGETAKARKTYEDYFALWSDADPGLQVLRDARQEYGRLQ